MIRFFRRKDIPEPLSPDQADALLGKIMTDLELEKPPRPGKKTYYHIVRRRYLVKRAAAAACILLLLACFGPGTVVPVAVSQVSAAPSSDSASVQISFQLGSVIPVREVTAEINDHALTVESDGYQQYTVTVEGKRIPSPRRMLHHRHPYFSRHGDLRNRYARARGDQSSAGRQSDPDLSYGRRWSRHRFSIHYGIR